MTLQTVKLSQLRLSPLNVRRVKPKAIDQLAADIAAHGLLQNLVVYAEGNRFEVAAGGRRYRALKQLEKARTIPSCHGVTVDVRDKAEAVELSLAENVQREAMHSADAVIAYGDLGRDGHSPEDIAARFGVALSYVKKVLRLSALHPDALDCLARDKIGMEAAQALTLTDDHDRQLEALKRCGNQAHSIRRMLTEKRSARPVRCSFSSGMMPMSRRAERSPPTCSPKRATVTPTTLRWSRRWQMRGWRR